MMPLDECFVAHDLVDTRPFEVQPANGEGEPGEWRNSHEGSLYACYGFWKELNLPQMQRDLAKQGLEIVASQKDSLQARKKLAEQTREFKKLSEEERSKELKTLLKAYQSEIDVLTRKAKMAEGAFLNVYKVLAEAPDPAPLFQEVMHHHVQMSEIGSLQVNNARLKEEIEAWAAEVTSLRGRDAEAKRLKQRLDKVESTMENVVKERVGVMEGQLRSELGEKLQQSIDLAQDLQRQLTIKQEEIARLQAVNDNTQAKLIQCSQLHDKEVTAKVGELEIVNFELQRTNRKIADLERRNELLREEVDTLRNHNRSEIMFAEFEQERKENEAKFDRWILEADERTAAFREKEAALVSRLYELEEQMLQKDDMISIVNARLAEVANYDDIKKELHILKSVEFNLSEVSGDEIGQNGEAVSGETKNTLQHLLLAKNKKLQSEVTTLKTAQEELHRRILHLTTELSQRSATVEHYQALSTRLEEDFLRINPGVAEPSRSPRLDHGVIKEIGGYLLSPAVAPVSSLAQTQSPGGEAADFLRSPTTAGDPDLLSIITAQRNRFRQRNTELEEELRKQAAALSEVQGKFLAVEQDNVKLYEKIKYMQSYGSNRSGASRVISMGQASSSSRQVNNPYQRFEDPVTERYRDMYEERLDPFKAFYRKEETRRYNSLNPADKATLSITRLLVGNRHFRVFLVVYSFMLHMLVLINTYQWAMTEECKHDHTEQICRQFATGFSAAGASVVGDPVLAA